MAAASSPALIRIAFPYEVCHNAARIGMWRTVAPIPDPSRTATETKATFEKRGTQIDSTDMRLAAGRLRQRTSSPISPPIQSEPETRWSQSKASASPRGAVWAACPDAPGTISAAAAATTAPRPARISAIERASRSGLSTQSATKAAAQKSAKQSSKSTYPRPNAVTRKSGTSAPTAKNERSESTAVASSR